MVEAKNPGRIVRNYIDSERDKIKYDAMWSVSVAKYTQDKELNQKILDDRFFNKEFVGDIRSRSYMGQSDCLRTILSW